MLPMHKEFDVLDTGEMSGFKSGDGNLLCLTKRWEHHTVSGGYDVLATALLAESEQERDFRYLFTRWAEVWRRFASTDGLLPEYQFGDWYAEWQLLVRANLTRPDLVHVLYGDEQLNVLFEYQQYLRCPLIATFTPANNRGNSV